MKQEDTEVFERKGSWSRTTRPTKFRRVYFKLAKFAELLGHLDNEKSRVPIKIGKYDFLEAGALEAKMTPHIST